MAEDTVLVTGGAGFAGSYIVRALIDAGFAPVVLDVADYRPEARFVIGEPVEDLAFETASIDEWPRVVEIFQRHRPRFVVHGGGIMDDAFLSGHPTIAFKTNVGGGLNMLEASRLMDVERFVFLSSIAVIGKVVYEPIDANHPIITATHGPLGAYGAAKASVESFCCSHHRDFGLDTRIVRPSAVYGFGMSWYAPNYVKNILEPAALGEQVSLASGAPVPRDFTSAVDIASLVVAVLQGPATADRVFYGATGEALRVSEDVAAIVRQLIPGADISIGDTMTPSDIAELPMRGRYSIANAETQLGWTPTLKDLRDGLEDYLTRFRAYIEAGFTPTPIPPGLRGAPGQGQ